MKLALAVAEFGSELDADALSRANASISAMSGRAHRGLDLVAIAGRKSAPPASIRRASLPASMRARSSRSSQLRTVSTIVRSSSVRSGLRSCPAALPG